MMEIVGWIGSALVILAYALNSYQKIRSDSLAFYLMNIIGAAILIVYSVHKDAAPNVFINLVWVVVAIPGVIRIFSRKRLEK
jgi:hypothetical protein